MGFVKLSNMPTPPKLRVSTVQNLRGGLNVHDLAWQISSDQSPDMKNMWWENGVLQSRPGQTTYNNGAVNDYDDTAVHDYDNLKAYGNLYHGWYVIYNPARECFTALAGADPQTSTDILGADGEVFNVEHPEGMFFLYADVLYFKSKGGYYKITRNAVRAFQAHNGLHADGIAGRETQELLFSAMMVLRSVLSAFLQKACSEASRRSISRKYFHAE